MPDWRALVSEHLRLLELTSEENREVVAELAAHLEDVYEEQIGKGLSESEAQRRTLNEIVRWRLLAQEHSTCEAQGGDL